MNTLNFNFHYRTNRSAEREVRTTALFIYSKLVAAGMDIQMAKKVIEDLFSAGQSDGYEAGYDAGQSPTW